MRVILITWEYPPKIVGGIARHVYDLSNAMVKLGIEVHVITCEHPGAVAEEVENGVYLYRVTPSGPGNDFVHWVHLLNDAMYARADQLMTELAAKDKAASRSVPTLIHAHDGPVASERYSLSPSLHDITSPARMGPFQYSATMYVCRADASSRWLKLERELSERARDLSGPEARWGVSSLIRYGLVVRGMARHAHQISQALPILWQLAKQSIWGRDALLPRKIY